MPGNEPVQALLRGLDIFTLITRNEGGMRLNEVAEELGLNLSTTHNLIKTLRLKGFIEKGQDGKFYTGTSIRETLKLRSEQDYLQSVAREMQALGETFPVATLTYVEERNSEIVVLLRISPEQPGIVQRPLNMRFQLYYNVSALLLLAFADSENALSLRYQHPFIEEGTKYWRDEAQLWAYLSGVRANGVAISPFDSEVACRLAVPLFSVGGDFRGGMGASVKLTDSNSRTFEDSLIAAMKEASENLSHKK